MNKFILIDMLLELSRRQGHSLNQIFNLWSTVRFFVKAPPFSILSDRGTWLWVWLLRWAFDTLFFLVNMDDSFWSCSLPGLTGLGVSNFLRCACSLCIDFSFKAVWIHGFGLIIAKFASLIAWFSEVLVLRFCYCGLLIRGATTTGFLN